MIRCAKLERVASDDQMGRAERDVWRERERKRERERERERER